MSDDANLLAAEAIAALKAKGLSVATAEATTGGLIGHLLTGVPGSSSVFVMGVAPYWNEVKVRLGVPEAVLREHGAASAEAAAHAHDVDGPEHRSNVFAQVKRAALVAAHGERAPAVDPPPPQPVAPGLTEAWFC